MESKRPKRVRRNFTDEFKEGAVRLPDSSPGIRSSFRPHIYSRDELERLLAATAGLANFRSPLQSLTFETILLLLYGAGLRAGEALRLRRCDVDLAQRILTIRNSKFFKSRLVPIGGELSKALEDYWSQRQWRSLPAGEESPFFATRSGHAVSLHRLEIIFRRLRCQAGIRRPATDRYQPRIHDLRHTFAVHRLLAWYREGADVQARLPYLATYLGHVSVVGTQAYLTMTPELLSAASQRFQRYASNKPRRP